MSETKLLRLDWKLSKTGSFAPVAIFDPVEFDGTIYDKCSLITVSNMKKIWYGDWHKGMTLRIVKAKRAVRIEGIACKEHYNKEDIFSVPENCPICGSPTEIRHYKGRESLFCTNKSCKSRLFGRIFHFIGKDAMNITGLTEKSVSDMMEQNLITEFRDFYYLKNRKAWLYLVPGFSVKKVDALLETIESSRETALARFIYALGIPRIGKNEAKAIAEHCEDFDDFLLKWKNLYAWSDIAQIDKKAEGSFNHYAVENWDKLILLISELNITSS